MYVPDVNDKSLYGTDSVEYRKNRKKKKNFQKKRSRGKHNCGTMVERYLTDEQYQKRMHEQGYTQADMEQFDRTALERKN